MEQKLATAEKKVLVEIVRLAQKRGMKGTEGGWKEFLDNYDKKLGSSLSDPSRRSRDVLNSFLNTFTKEDDLKLFAKVLQSHLNRDVVDQYTKDSPDNETPEQRLVRLTLEHPQYPSYYMFPSYDEEWVVTKLKKKSKMMNSNAMLAVDCEMVLCEDGTEALVRVCVVDRDLQVKLNELVKPNKAIAKYRSEITGVTARDLDGVTCTLADIQKSMKNLLSNGTILVGHSLNNDLQAMKLDHGRVIDTSLIYRYSEAPIHRRPSLNNLCKSVLGLELRKKDAPHNCLDDARAAMKLVLAKIEQGVDNDIPLVQEDVSDAEMAKLLLHRIPVNVPSEELHRVISGDFTIEIKQPKKTQGDKYSALAIFKNPQEAYQAFENVNGCEEKDSSGRTQKLMTFRLSTGVTASLYVRKMVHDSSLSQVCGKKRVSQGEESPGEFKKLKACQGTREETTVNANLCIDHLKEIEKLKQDLKEKDFQISRQAKLISELKKKVNEIKKKNKKKSH